MVHTYSGFENKVAEAIESRAKIFGLRGHVGRVIVPTEKVARDPQEQEDRERAEVLPGYVLVEMELTDDTWHLVRSRPKVTGFVGSGARPVPLPPDEVEAILSRWRRARRSRSSSPTFQRGDKVRVIEGPFVNFQGASTT